MKYILTLFFLLSLLVNVNSQIEVSFTTWYQVPDSLKNSYSGRLEDSHPHSDFMWCHDDIYFNEFPYYEEVINFYGTSTITFTIDTTNFVVTKSYSGYEQVLREVSSHKIDYFIFDESGFSIQLSAGDELRYNKVIDEECEFYKEMGETDECLSQFIYFNENNEIEFIVKEQYNNLIFVGY